MKRDIINILIILLLIFLLEIPFLNKAFHTDDTAFIYMAQQIKIDPWRPYSFVLEWGSHTNELATHLLDTPLVSYYMALISILFGMSEIALHFSFILFHIIAGISVYYLLKRFTKWPLQSSLIVLSTTTFLVSSQSVMLDVPMMSLFVLAIVLFIYGVDRDDSKLVFAGSVAAGFVYLAKPNGIFVIPLMTVYCILSGKRKYIFYQLIPVAFIVLFSLHNYYFEDKILIKEYVPFLYGKKGNSLNVVFAYFFSNLSYIGGATIFPLFFVYPFVKKNKNKYVLASSIIIAAVTSFMLYKLSSNFVSGQYTSLQILLFFVFVMASIFFIFLALIENYPNAKLLLSSLIEKTKNKKADINMFFIFVWFIGIYILNSGISGGAVRYNVLLVVPLVLMFVMLLEKYLAKDKISKFLFIVFLFTLMVGLAVAYGDYLYANTYRDFAFKVQKYKTSSNSIFYSGALGFQYYMDKSGYKMLMQNDASPKKGDYVIVARLPSPRRISQLLMQRLKPLETVSYIEKFPIRTQNPEAHAGFYTYGGGFLPYSISNSALENFDIYYVEK